MYFHNVMAKIWDIIPIAKRTIPRLALIFIVLLMYVACLISPIGWLYWMFHSAGSRVNRFVAIYRIISSIVAFGVLVLTILLQPGMLFAKELPVIATLAFIIAIIVMGLAACDNIVHTITRRHIGDMNDVLWVRTVVYVIGVSGYSTILLIENFLPGPKMIAWWLCIGCY